MVVGGKLASFWKISDSQQFGDGFVETGENGDQENYACHKDGTCEISRVHYEYLNADKRNPVSAEWRDSERNLMFGAYCDYEVDSYGNWTRRTVSVWSPALNGRKMYETDVREIKYW